MSGVPLKVKAGPEGNCGVPTKILYEALGTTISVETNTGEVFRGNLTNVEDNMNIELEQVTHTNRKGATREMASTYVRGSSIVFFMLPEMLKLSPAVISAAVPNPPPERGRGRGFGAAATSGRAGAARPFGSKRPRE